MKLYFNFQFIYFKVVNDVAERGVALITQFNKCITNNEEQRQYLLQVVENYRKVFKNCDKKTLVKNLDFV